MGIPRELHKLGIWPEEPETEFKFQTNLRTLRAFDGGDRDWACCLPEGRGAMSI